MDPTEIIQTHTSNAEACKEPHQSSREPCNEASEGPSSPRSSEPSEDEASESPCSLHNSEPSEDPSSPTTSEPCNGPSSHSNTKPCHEDFEGPSSLIMDNEASKRCPSSSNNICVPYKGHSSLSINSDNGYEDMRVMDPANIRYSRTRFSRSFTPSILRTHLNTSTSYMSYAEVRKAAESDLLLDSLLSKLRTGHTTVDAVSPICVIFYKNSWYSLDNRRLWVFKQFGMPIPVRVTTDLNAFLQKFQQDGDNLTAAMSSDIHACGTIKPRPNKDGGLLDYVFEWSINDIMDDKLLKSKVKVIPTQFESLTEYFTSFKWPLLEEVRAQVKQSLELIQKAPCARLAQISKRKTPKNLSLSKSFKKFQACISQEHIRNKQQKDGTQFKFKSKDLLLLSRNPPGFEGLECSKEGNVMAFVQNVEDDDGPPLLRILVLSSHEEELMDRKKTWYAIYLSGLATTCRIWNALNPVDMKGPIFGIIEKTFDYHHQSTTKQDETLSTQWLKQSIERYCSTRLNESQTSAVVTTVSDVKNGLNPGVRMIQGPPGTGKTSTVVTLLSVAASSHMKCLVACPTNTAVAEVALRYLEMLEAPGKMQFGDFCKSAGCSDIESSEETAKTHKVLEKKDIVLVGNEEKLPLKGQLREIYLPSRVELIHTANNSWRSVALSLSSFIVSFESRYQEQLTREDADPLKHTSLLGFVRSNLEKLIMQLTEHGNTLVQELPIDQTEEFLETSKLAETFLNSILDPTLCEQDFPEWLSSNESAIELVNQLQEFWIVKHGHLFSKESIEKLCLQSSSIFFCTVSTAGRHCMKHAAPFDCLIIDEAAQLVEAETAIVACLPGLNHAILVGDHKQLPATVISKVAVDSGYGRSLFERMISLKHPCHLLNIQYRMHPSISLFPNTKFYKDRLLNGDNVRGPAYRLHEDLLYGSYAFLDVSDGAEQTAHDGKSKKNLVEAAVVVAIVEKLCEVSKRNNIHNLSVGIITPYSSQRDHLRTCLEAKKMEPLLVDVNSVDGFQGQEKDVIIISTVRANKHGAIGFLEDERRLNVAITRARYCLWIVGCSKTLQGERNIWAALLKDATDREAYKRAVNDTGIAKAIIKAKKEINAYSDLLKTGSALFNNMLWKVNFSNDFKNSFPQIKLLEKREKIVKRICRISSGHHFSKYKMECVPPTDKLYGLIEVDMVADLCLVWNIDIERDGEAIQIIKIWNIVNRSTLPILIKRLQAAFNVYSEHYIERCKIRRLSRDKELTVPERWLQDPDFVWLKPHERSTQVAGSQYQSFQSDSANLENSSVSESLLLMKFYTLSSGIAKNLLTAEDGSEVNLPFQVNKEESLIIQHQSSCFILGRSGTGKTTVLITRLIQREQQNQISISGLKLSEAPPEATNEMTIADKEHIRQIFVTLSPLLCSDIKQQITQIQRTLSAAAESTSAQHHSNSDYELLLDGDIESKVMGLLPKTFIDVPSKYYPMVLTFRKFLMMLTNSVPCPFFKDKTKSSYQRKEIDYDRFDSEYWPHFNANLTKKFDSSTVFTEIMSVIKGSVQAVKSDRGFLSKDLYCLLNSSTKQLSVVQKEDIYNLFVQYEKLKMETNCYDMADWVKHTYKQLYCGEYHGDKIDFVYIDEVQDFTQAQLSLFSFVCTNIKEGYIFAGDTAQTIARGVHFRFQDGRSLFYTDFKESSHTCESNAAAAANTCNSKEFKTKLFQLRHNFRTHMGVVKVANSIVQLLYHFFPQAIDKLDPETSLVWGQLPALLKGQQEELVKTMQNMGAQQVIIVRDEAQKAQLLEQTGKSGLVLTISGCKGLEFQDVLLYNFFSGSVMQNKWKVLYDYPFQTNVMKSTDISEKKAHPTFDPNKHHLLCSELKHLYVAVTRARERLWIFEDNNDFCKPMLDYWLGHELIETKILDQSFVSSMKSSSTPDDWRKTGFKLFNRQHYDDAMLCFERAGDEHYVGLAKAASLKQKGEKQLSTNRREAIDKLREAAELFLVLKNGEKAAECYITLGDLQKAGVLYIENCKPPKFEDAGDCFLEAKSWLEAGEAYFGGGCINKCLDTCFKGKHFEKGLSFIKHWMKEPLTDDFQENRIGYEEVINEYLQKCAASFHQQHSIMTMMMFVNAFSSIDLKRVFLRGRNCFHELMSMEEAEGNYLQAAELAGLKGDLLHAATLLEKAGDYDNAVKKVLLVILKDALWGEQNRGWSFRTMKRPEELLRRVERLAALAESSVRHEVQLEVQLIFEALRNPQDVRYLIAHTQTLSSEKIKFLTTWKALDAFLRILKETQQPNRQKLVPNRNAMLVQTLSLWIDWQDFVLCCKKAVLGQENLQKAIPESAQDDIRDFCYEFFGVTQGEDSKVCFVHNIQAYWFESHKKGVPPIKISMKEFAKLSVKFWNEQLFDKEKAITEMCHLPTQLLTLLWPQVRKAEEMFGIQKLLKATTIVAILEKIADQITSDPQKVYTLEATGRLQLIFPFLSEAWKKENVGSFKTRVAFWKCAVTVNWRNPSLSVEDYVVECGQQLIKVFYSDWKNIQEYISPKVFVDLLERVVVMACACNTLLHEMFLPMTLAVEVMCGKAQEVLYQNILIHNTLSGESLDLLIASINKIAFQLLKEPTDLEEWFKNAQGDPNTDLPPMVLRLTTLLFIMSLNARDPKLKEFLIGKLQQMFHYQAPKLRQLPRSYMTECRNACFLISRTGAGNNESMKQLKYAFAKALTSIGDSLVMTRCKNECCCKALDGISTIELDCETDISMKLQTLASVYASSETCKAQHNSQMPASFVQDRQMEAAARTTSTEKDEYNTYLNKTAFPLKVTRKHLRRLASVISHHNLLDAKERLQQEILYLDPSHSKHTEYNLKWLKARVNQVQETSNEVEKLQEEVKKFEEEVKADDDGDDDAASENEEGQNQGNAGSIASQGSTSNQASTSKKKSRKSNKKSQGKKKKK